jgi:hypothetical protein
MKLPWETGGVFAIPKEDEHQLGESNADRFE